MPRPQRQEREAPNSLVFCPQQPQPAQPGVLLSVHQLTKLIQRLWWAGRQPQFSRSSLDHIAEMSDLEDYGFDYSDDECAEEDVDIENQYYNSKGDQPPAQ